MGNLTVLLQVVNVGAVPLLVLCSQEPEVVLKHIAAFSLRELAKHSAEQAQSVVDAGAVAYLAPLLQIQDIKVKRQVCVHRTLAQHCRLCTGNTMCCESCLQDHFCQTRHCGTTGTDTLQ